MEWRKPAVDHVMNMIAFVLLGEAYNNQPQNLKYTYNKLLVHNVDRVECIMWTECGVWSVEQLYCFNESGWNVSEEYESTLRRGQRYPMKRGTPKC